MIALVFLLAVAQAAAAATTKRGGCTFDLSYGLSVDLSGLSDDVYFESGKYSFAVNLCKPNDVTELYVLQFLPDYSETWAVADTKPLSGILTAAGFDLVYSGGSWGSGCESYRSALFHMICGQEDESRRAFLRETDCLYEFNWVTPLACVGTSSCHVTTADGYEFDLTPLAGQVFSTPNSVYPNLQENFVLCDTGDYVRVCGPGAAVCETSISGTPPPATLATFPVRVVPAAQHSLVMTFTKATGDSGATVTVNFVCDYSANKGDPVMLSDVSGVMSFVWKTAHACPVGATGPGTSGPGASTGLIVAIVIAVVFAVLAGGIAVYRGLKLGRSRQVANDQVPLAPAEDAGSTEEE